MKLGCWMLRINHSIYKKDLKSFAEVGLYIAKEDFTFNQVGYNEIPTTYEALPVEVQAAFKARPFGEVYQYFLPWLLNQ